MMRALHPSTWYPGIAAILALALLAVSSASAQYPSLPDDPWKPAVLDRERGRPDEVPTEAEAPGHVAPRPRLIRMPAEIRGDPTERDGSDRRLRVQFGEDNRFLDLRRPGAPGGAGYQKLQSELQVYDNGATGFRLGLQALRPSGMEWDGLKEGPTIVSPTMAVVQDLGEGIALQGFIGKDLRPGTQWTEGLERNLQYGMALQTPMPLTSRSAGSCLYLFVEALGRYRHEDDCHFNGPVAWELLPGLHWRNTQTWWMSGGVLLPVGPGRPDSGLLQFNCSLQF